MENIRIYHVNPKFLQTIIDQRASVECFLTKKNEKWKAVDNTAYGAWAEEFAHRVTAIHWLRGELEVSM